MIVWLRNLIRPVCQCCDGKGHHQAYYEPEYYGCRCCNPNEDREEPVTRVWFWQAWWQRFDDWREERRIDRLIREDKRLGE